MSRITKTLGYEGNTNWNSFNYLGVPIHKGKNKSSDLKGIVENIEKIYAWGEKCLNPTGKLILINSILAAYPIYSC